MIIATLYYISVNTNKNIKSITLYLSIQSACDMFERSDDELSAVRSR